MHYPPKQCCKMTQTNWVTLNTYSCLHKQTGKQVDWPIIGQSTCLEETIIVSSKIHINLCTPFWNKIIQLQEGEFEGVHKLHILRF